MASVEFDPKVNAIYIRLKEGKVEESEPLADNIIVNIDEEGEIVGIEVLLPKLDEKQKEFVVRALRARV